MRVVLTSVFVDDQDKALKFYTEKLGFVKKKEIPMGTMRSFLPFPRTFTCCVIASTSCRFSPWSSDNRMPVE